MTFQNYAVYRRIHFRSEFTTLNYHPTLTLLDDDNKTIISFLRSGTLSTEIAKRRFYVVKHKYLLAALAAGVTSVTSMPVYATTLEKVEFTDLVDQASVIILGRAVDADVTTVNGELVTRTTFSVEDVAAGDVGPTIMVHTPGGSIKNTKVRMGEVHPGVPVFARGTSAVLLLKSNNGDAYSVLGYNQGVFSVFNDGGVPSVNLPDGDDKPVAASRAMRQMQEMRDDDDFEDDDD